mmetsp:Transcript_105645/g.303816  ORF Transcript_105645/g.303816 Transcript_105645/m.303816 type:complete len:251 (-) Transcript_105645:790-1542(-)
MACVCTGGRRCKVQHPRRYSTLTSVRIGPAPSADADSTKATSSPFHGNTHFSKRAAPSASSMHSRTARAIAEVRFATAPSKALRPCGPRPSHSTVSTRCCGLATKMSFGGILTSAPWQRSRKRFHRKSSGPWSSLASCPSCATWRPVSSNLWLSARGGGLLRTSFQAAKLRASGPWSPELYNTSAPTRISSSCPKSSSAVFIQSRSPKPSGSRGVTPYFLQMVRYKSCSWPEYFSSSFGNPSSFASFFSL